MDAEIVNNSPLLTIFQACNRGFRSLRLDSERECIMLSSYCISSIPNTSNVKSVFMGGGAGVCLCWAAGRGGKEGGWRFQCSKVK